MGDGLIVLITIQGCWKLLEFGWASTSSCSCTKDGIISESFFKLAQGAKSFSETSFLEVICSAQKNDLSPFLEILAKVKNFL